MKKYLTQLLKIAKKQQNKTKKPTTGKEIKPDFFSNNDLCPDNSLSYKETSVLLSFKQILDQNAPIGDSKNHFLEL